MATRRPLLLLHVPFSFVSLSSLVNTAKEGAEEVEEERCVKFDPGPR